MCIGILVVIAGLIGIGYWSQKTSPDKIFEEVLTTLANKVKEQLNRSSDLDYTKNDISVVGNIKIDTDYNLPGLEEFLKYTYAYQMDVSLAKKIIKMNLSMLEDGKEVLNVKVLNQNSKNYLDIPDVLPNILELGDVLELDTNMSDISTDKNDYITLVEETKNILLDTMDKTKITVNKNVEKMYNNQKTNVKEYVYLLDEENQR